MTPSGTTTSWGAQHPLSRMGLLGNTTTTVREHNIHHWSTTSIREHDITEHNRHIGEHHHQGAEHPRTQPYRGAQHPPAGSTTPTSREHNHWGSTTPPPATPAGRSRP